MPKRLSFAQFDARLKSGTLSAAEHRRYLEVDPTADFVRVRFKAGAFLDPVPMRYDVDREVYLAQRAQQERTLSVTVRADQKRVVAEGDSWFNLPPYIRPQAIADRIKSNKRVAVKNIAKWGDTLVNILDRKEYLEEIPKFKPDWFIFSAGGNDLQELLKRGGLVQRYAPNRPIDKCLSSTGTALLEDIAEGYRTLLNQIAMKHHDLRSICYAYDFPKPTYKDGEYIGQYLKKMGYPKSVWNAVGVVIINSLTKAVKPVVAAFPNATFLDCRGTTASHRFFDDMHPHNEGFEVLADRFEEAFGVASTKPARVKTAASRSTPGRNARGERRHRKEQARRGKTRGSKTGVRRRAA